MLLMRKSAKRAILTAFILCAIYGVYVVFIGEPPEFRNNRYKINIIEDGILSVENQNECHMPDLPVNSPEMMAFLKNEPPIQCDDVEAWVSCGTDRKLPWVCWIENSIIDRLGPITCDFIEIIRPDNDFDVELAQRVRSKEFYELKKSDFVRVKCWTDERDNRQYWKGILTGIRKDAHNHELPKVTKEMPFNVIMFGFDSLSRNAWIRKLPNTYEYMTKHLHADVLQGYNIVGDGTPQALIPLLTGYTELELPETRKRISESGYVNSYPMIFNEYARHSYVAAFNEDLPDVGTFSYRLNGFQEQPTTHYMRPFYLAFQSEMKRHKRLCVGDTPRHQVMMDYTQKFMQAYRERKPQFAFSFHGELSHDSINLVGVADNDVKEWLEGLNNNGFLNRTILILMADHGNRFAEVRNTLQGKLEERLPFFSFIFPEAFKKRYAKEYGHFKENLQRLVTPFDVHETFLDLLRVQESDGLLEKQSPPAVPKSNITYDQILRANKFNRAISLLKPVPKERTCADAYIEPHWCSCLSLNFLDPNSDLVKRAANAIVDKINIYTSEERHLCHMLTISNITWAGTLQPRKTLLKFKQNRDMDGYLADLTSTTTKITKDLYQLQIHVQPGDSIFEASLTHNLFIDQFIVNITDVSRINMYGDQARCIMDKNPDLRKFCYCR
ncbi:uncharacterized protein LOC116347703 [Contarinia nasturtii]|uniref:uncharacterized protein LOC116347703 n=1 Tax=Contarinia nasturtii TaxID=265458 RepID=UPI0012D4B3C4|nr:uncharacterized protein LOC116347703 [Contarinia nasturtii]XP_031634269.1 uncharacterized protein LOC116347703 [Contarinia nasturtii]XP_031634271.1 uncharacterized protein LOC116347703 [Contarinia nasturtii]